MAASSKQIGLRLSRFTVTFEQLKAEYATFANASWAGMAQRLGLIERRLVGVNDM